MCVCLFVSKIKNNNEQIFINFQEFVMALGTSASILVVMVKSFGSGNAVTILKCLYIWNYKAVLNQTFAIS